MVVLVMLMTLLLNSCKASAEFQRFEQSIKTDGSLRFLVVGDWGRNGDFNQSEVAFQMGRIGEKLDIDFVVSTGDNFYDDGLKGVHDPNFIDSFTNIYTAHSLQTQWFSVLGNHDYRGDAVAQLSPILREIDTRWICSRSFIVNTEIAELFFVDTTPFVNDYFTNPEDHVYDWRHVSPVKAYTANLLKDLESALKESRARWKIVVGHHAIRSVSHHGDTQELLHQLLPILQANKVDLYVNGHDHCLQRISDNKRYKFGVASTQKYYDPIIIVLFIFSPIQFLTGEINTRNQQGLKFFYDGQGFMSVELTPSEVEIVFYDVFGVVLHRCSLSKHHLDHSDM